MVSIINCKQCGKIFHSAGSGVLCQDCEKSFKEELSKLYRIVQDHPGLSLEQLAQRSGFFNASQIEQLTLQGKLGTATQLVNVTCPKCRQSVPGSSMVGRFCSDCADEVQKTGKIGAYREPEAQPVAKPSSPAPGLPAVKPAASAPKSAPAEAPPSKDPGNFGFRRNIT